MFFHIWIGLRGKVLSFSIELKLEEIKHLVHFGTIGKARCGWKLVIAAAASASRVYRSCDFDKFKMLKRDACSAVWLFGKRLPGASCTPAWHRRGPPTASRCCERQLAVGAAPSWHISRQFISVSHSKRPRPEKLCANCEDPLSAASVNVCAFISPLHSHSPHRFNGANKPIGCVTYPAWMHNTNMRLFIVDIYAL